MKHTNECEVRMPNYTYDMSSTIHLEKVQKEKCQNDNCGYFLMAELILLNKNYLVT